VGPSEIKFRTNDHCSVDIGEDYWISNKFPDHEDIRRFKAYECVWEADPPGQARLSSGRVRSPKTVLLGKNATFNFSPHFDEFSDDCDEWEGKDDFIQMSMLQLYYECYFCFNDIFGDNY